MVRLPVHLGGAAGSSDNADDLDSSNGDGPEADAANWDEEIALQKHWNAVGTNEPDPVDYELEELDKSGHLDDYGKRK